MVSVTIQVPENMKVNMKKCGDVNWSAYLREQIKEKIDDYLFVENFLRKNPGIIKDLKLIEKRMDADVKSGKLKPIPDGMSIREYLTPTGKRSNKTRELDKR
ncbi:MAG: hypothetical protein J4432_04100 [DPANN group archaeon]|nr:hypothetical protein [DPANN group archaeon]